MTDYSAELRALTVLANGGNRADSARAAHYSVPHLCQRLKRLRELLGAKNNTALVAMLLRAGQIEFPAGDLTERVLSRTIR